MEFNPITDLIQTLADAGYVIVPREPTTAMIAAANRLNHPRDEEVWRTMIDAALREQSEKPAGTKPAQEKGDE